MHEQSTGHQRQSPPPWLTHAAYPAGEHPAQPAPEPAPFMADPQQLAAELAQTRELLQAVLDAVNVPAPVSLDREHHRDLVVSRSRDVRIGLRGFLEGSAPAETALDWLRQTVRDFPVRYRVEGGA